MANETQQESTNRVAEFRGKRGMKQSELAEAVGISQPAVSQIEHGRSTSKGRQQQIAAALGVKQVRTLFPA